MKTPREILLARHRAAEPKLDAIRRSLVKEMNSQDAKTQSFLSSFVPLRLCCSNRIWLELIWPCRRTWTGLAAVWSLILIVNVLDREPLSSVTGKPAHASAMMMSWQTQQRWMSELLADRAVAPGEAARPRDLTPKPRTETLKWLTT